MKRILLSLITIVAVSAAVVNGVNALFSDTETSTGNTFAAGTLDLKLNGGDVNVTIFTVTLAKPGDTGGATWIVNNAGTIAGYLDLHSLTLTNNDNDCTEPESIDGDGTCGPVGGGELSANMNVDLFVDANNNGTNDSETTIYTGLLSGIAANYPDLNLALAASGTNYIRLNWGIPSGTGNVIQSDSTQLDATFELGQTAGQ